MKACWPMLGELIERLNRPEVGAAVLVTLDPSVLRRLERRALEASMTIEDFAAGAVREFVQQVDDELWFQLLTVIRKAEDPGTVAVQTILRWVVTEHESPG